jgi:predicted metal-dependent phosphoesterase TrpH
MTTFDLHMHSTYSDGSCGVDRLIDEAREQGLAGIAVTDHDWLEQLSSVRAIARKRDFPVLAGIEVSAYNPATGRKVHILGYGLEATPDLSGPVEKLVAPTRVARTANTLWQAWTLMRAGVSFKGNTVDLDEVVQVGRRSGCAFRQHIMWALTRLPYTDPDYQALYRTYFKNGGMVQRSISYPDAHLAVRAIREQGGVAVLAHPGQMDSWGMIPDLVKEGLQGIEAHHPDHSAQDVERAREAARTYGLFLTGGSDYHGIYGAPATVGACGIDAEEAGERVAALFEAEKKLM